MNEECWSVGLRIWERSGTGAEELNRISYRGWGWNLRGLESNLKDSAEEAKTD